VTIRIKIRSLEALQPRQDALLVYLKLSDNDIGTDEEEIPIQQLEMQLERVVQETEVGTYEEAEVGGGYYKLVMYGPDVEQIFEAVLPVIFQFPAAPGSFLVKGYADNGAVRLVHLENGAVGGREGGQYHHRA
jgi:hypothetical protein